MSDGMAAVALSIGLPYVATGPSFAFVCSASASEVLSLGADTTTILTGTLSAELKLTWPLPVVVESDEAGGFVASEDSIGFVYGVGSTKAEAIRDLVVALVEYHGHVARLSGSGDPATQGLWRHVQARISQRS